MAEIAIPRVRRLLLEAATPILKVVGKVHTPPHYRIEFSVESRVATLWPGDSLVSRRDWELTNPIIPGFFKHAAMYIGDGRVIEAIGRGVIETSIEEFLTTKDFVRARRPKFLDKVGGVKVAAIAKSMQGREYDYLVEPSTVVYGQRFEGTKEAFYCSEVCWKSYEAYLTSQGLSSPFTPRVTLQVATVTPMDIALADRCFETIWDLRS